MVALPNGPDPMVIAEKYIRLNLTSEWDQEFLNNVVNSQTPRALLIHTALLIGTAIGRYVESDDDDIEADDCANMSEACTQFLESCTDEEIRDLYVKE